MARNLPSPVLLVRGTNAQIADTVGGNGEVMFDTEVKTIVVHDGTQRGGYPMMRQDMGVRKAGDTMTGPLKMPTPQKGTDDNTGATCDWVNDILWGKSLNGLLPTDLSFTLQDMPVGAFLNMPDIQVPDEDSNPEIDALAARVSTLELATSTLQETSATQDYVNSNAMPATYKWGKWAATLPDNIAALVADMPVGSFLSVPEPALEPGNPAFDALAARVAALELQVSTLPDVADLAAKVAALEANVATTAALEAAKTRITTLENQVMALQAQAVSVAVTTLPADPSSLINTLPLGGFISTPE